MVKIEVETVPEKKEDKQVSYKVEKLVEDRNNVIAKDFKVDPKKVKVKLQTSTGALKSSLDPNGDKLGVFGGYVDGSDHILLIHPASVDGLLEDVWKELSILADYGLIKFYLCQIYYPEKDQFKLYYKHVSEALAQVVSGKLNEGIVKFDIKTFFEGKRYTKEQELMIAFYLLQKYSGTHFIFEHLDQIMEEKDIKTTLMKVLKKSLADLIKPEKDKILIEDRKLRDAERIKRASNKKN